MIKRSREFPTKMVRLYIILKPECLFEAVIDDLIAILSFELLETNKGQSSASAPTMSSKSNKKKSSGLSIRPFGAEDDDDDNPKQKRLF